MNLLYYVIAFGIGWSCGAVFLCNTQPMINRVVALLTTIIFIIFSATEHIKFIP